MKYPISLRHAGGLLLFIVSWSNHVFAQDESNPSIAEADIIVSGTRSEDVGLNIPASISVIDAEEISLSGADTLSEVLRGYGAIQINDLYGDGTRATVDMRGFGESASSNTLVLVDGRRLNNTDISAPDLSSVSLKEIERIEIIQGSAGALFGDQAVGGVINVITREPESFTADFQISGGSYGRNSATVAVADRLDRGFSYRFSAETLSSDNYRKHNRLDYTNVFARAGYFHNSGKVFVELQAITEDAEQPGALTATDVERDRRQSLPDFENDFNDVTTNTARLGMEQGIGESWLFALEYTDTQADTDFILNFMGCTAFMSCVTDTDKETREQQMLTPRFVGRYDTGVGDLVITVGADGIDSSYEINSDTVNRTNEQEIESLYLQAVVPVSRRFSYTVGGRKARVSNRLVDTGGAFGPGLFPDGVDVDDDVTVGSFGFTVKPSEDWRIFTRLDQNLRFAKLDEQVFTESGATGLETQTGDSVELGTEWRGLSGRRFKLVAYQLELENEIGFDPTADGPWGPGSGANVNFESTERNGLILEGRMPIGDGFTVAGSWTELDAEFKSGIYAGNHVSGVADRIVTLSMEARVGENWRGYLQVQHTGEQYLSGDNANLLPLKESYNVANMNIRYASVNWSISLRINNLFDTEYSESENAFGAISPSPLRNFLMSTEYHFN